MDIDPVNTSSLDYNDAWLTYAWTKWLRAYARGGAVVDLGCGIGANGAILARLAGRRVVGLDRDWGCLGRSRGRGLSVACSDLNGPLPIGRQTADIALLVHCIEHIPDPSALLDGIAAMLTPGGALVVVTPDWNRSAHWFYDDPTHCRPYTAALLRRVLEEAGLTVRVLKQHNVGYHLGRTRLWKVFKSLCFTGDGLFAIAESPGRTSTT